MNGPCRNRCQVIRDPPVMSRLRTTTDRVKANRTEADRPTPRTGRGSANRWPAPPPSSFVTVTENAVDHPDGDVGRVSTAIQEGQQPTSSGVLTGGERRGRPLGHQPGRGRLLGIGVDRFGGPGDDGVVDALASQLGGQRPPGQRPFLVLGPDVRLGVRLVVDQTRPRSSGPAPARRSADRYRAAPACREIGAWPGRVGEQPQADVLRLRLSRSRLRGTAGTRRC